MKYSTPLARSLPSAALELLLSSRMWVHRLSLWTRGIKARQEGSARPTAVRAPQKPPNSNELAELRAPLPHNPMRCGNGRELAAHFFLPLSGFFRMPIWFERTTCARHAQHCVPTAPYSMDGDGHDDIVQLQVRVASVITALARLRALTPWPRGLISQASVERLRQQRAQVERIKWESKKKDACIGFLREEIAKLNEQVRASRLDTSARLVLLHGPAVHSPA